ncbi:hypothetical protein U9M48_030362 [Paspalum notatum var. saurae]|uniref:CCHC-type domain-containing protein n=1 Tax=Paspalum notatum var. saurae TaxID=547442 RepID=A0AAQ3U562_PASNO
MALAAILRGVPSELKVVLAVKKTAKEAWEAGKTMRVGEDRDGEKIDDFAVHINGIVGGLRELGEEIKDGRVVRKVLRVVPKKWKQVAVSIEMLLDLDTMTMEELVGRLRVAEQADDKEAAAAADVGRLHLTEEQWEARHRQRLKERARGRDGRHGIGNRRSRGGDDDRSEHDDDDASSIYSGRSRRGRRSSPRCFERGERGHLARQCRERKKKEAALLASTEEEPTLL